MSPGVARGKFSVFRGHVAGIGAFPDAGFDEVHIAPVGGATEGFSAFYPEQVRPRLRDR
jgi:hypothetical protein